MVRPKVLPILLGQQIGLSLALAAARAAPVRPGPPPGRSRRRKAKAVAVPKAVPEPKFAAAVNKLTGWQRNQWARAGYPGLADKDPKPVRKFARMKRKR
ncbi:MAG TPA: hypothetical protein VF194_15130 [Ferrovibrio sp.]|uniref:hypothetical protein n=1 Tax=Ferrovibrio sp. TaxID=1917215 RepID=UPI002ED2AAEA